MLHTEATSYLDKCSESLFLAGFTLYNLRLQCDTEQVLERAYTLRMPIIQWCVAAIKIGKGQVSFSALTFRCIKFTSDLFYQSHRGAEQFLDWLFSVVQLEAGTQTPSLPSLLH